MDFLIKNKQILILVGLWLSLILSVFLLREILLPFILAILVAYILDPLILKMSAFSVKGKKLPKIGSLAIIYVIASFIIYIFSTIFLPEFYWELLRLGRTITENLAFLKETNLQVFMNNLFYYLKYYQLPFQELDLIQLFHSIIMELSEFIKTQSANIILEIQSLAKKMINFAGNSVLILMIAGFILIDPAKIKVFLVHLVIPKYRQDFDLFLHKIDQGLSGVVRGQLIICLVNTILTLIGLIFLEIKFTFALAGLAGLLSIIPVFGSILSTIPIALVALMNSTKTCFFAILWIAFIHLLEANILNPKIIGNSAKIHPLFIVFALMAGEHYHGVSGALLAVPAASVFSTVFEFLLEKAYKQ